MPSKHIASILTICCALLIMGLGCGDDAPITPQPDAGNQNGQTQEPATNPDWTAASCDIRLEFGITADLKASCTLTVDTSTQTCTVGANNGACCLTGSSSSSECCVRSVGGTCQENATVRPLGCTRVAGYPESCGEPTLSTTTLTTETVCASNTVTPTDGTCCLDGVVNTSDGVCCIEMNVWTRQCSKWARTGSTSTESTCSNTSVPDGQEAWRCDSGKSQVCRQETGSWKWLTYHLQARGCINGKNDCNGNFSKVKSSRPQTMADACCANEAECHLLKD